MVGSGVDILRRSDGVFGITSIVAPLLSSSESNICGILNLLTTGGVKDFGTCIG